MGSSQRVALGASAAVACLMVGLLLGVLAGGGRAARVLSVIRDPIAPANGATTGHSVTAPALTVTVTRTRTNTTTRTEPPRTVTVTRTVTTPGSTRIVSQPASTVTVTETTTATTPPTSGP